MKAGRPTGDALLPQCRGLAFSVAAPAVGRAFGWGCCDAELSRGSCRAGFVMRVRHAGHQPDFRRLCARELGCWEGQQS